LESRKSKTASKLKAKKTGAIRNSIAQRHYGVDGAKQDQRERKRNVKEQPVM
jgi:hypothetical protein